MATPEGFRAGGQNGCELNCGETYPALVEAVRRRSTGDHRPGPSGSSRRASAGHVRPARDGALARSYENACLAHRAVSLQAARESVVLLKNEGGFLPLRKDLGAIAVIG